MNLGCKLVVLGSLFRSFVHACVLMLLKDVVYGCLWYVGRKQLYINNVVDIATGYCRTRDHTATKP